MINRRSFIATGTSGLLLGGCDRLNNSASFRGVLRSAEKLTMATQRLISPRNALAREYRESDLSPVFRSNGTARPNTDDYDRHVAENFANWRLAIDGLVARPLSIPIGTLRALPHRTQITRHDCVEGWSAIGKWQGTLLSAVLDHVGADPQARFVVFHCFDEMDVDTPYYESVDIDEARHPQTLLAFALNDKPLPVPNGAPLRLRVGRQLGYKQAKYLSRIELVKSFDAIGDGKGGYWEDQGYEWYAGI